MELKELWENVPKQFCYKQTHLICQDVLKYTKFNKTAVKKLDPSDNNYYNSGIKNNNWFITTEEPSREIKLIVDECFGKTSDDEFSNLPAKFQKSYELVLDISMDGMTGAAQEILVERWIYNFYEDVAYHGFTAVSQKIQTKAARKLYKDLSLHFKVLYSFLLLLPRSPWIRKRIHHHYYTDVYAKFHVRTQTSIRKTVLQFDTPPKEFVFKNIRGSDNFNIHADACVLYRPTMPEDVLLRLYPKVSSTPGPMHKNFPAVVASAPILIPKKPNNNILSATIYENYVQQVASPPHSLQMSMSPIEKEVTKKIQSSEHQLSGTPPSLIWNNSIDFFEQEPPFMTPYQTGQNQETDIAQFLKVLKECERDMFASKNFARKTIDMSELEKQLDHFENFQIEAKKLIFG